MQIFSWKICSGLIPIILVVTMSVASAAAESSRILVLGDSLVAGYGLAEQEAFPNQLEQELQSAGYKVQVINAGVSGDTTAGGLSRLDWALVDRPHIAIIVLGGNDALRGLPPEETRRNLDKIIVRLKQERVAILLTGMRAPRNFGSDYYNKFDRLYPELAIQHGVAFYRFFLAEVATVSQYNQADGIHPNPQGVKMIVRQISPVIKEMLEDLPAP